MGELFKPGQNYFLASDSPSAPYGAVFEDDGETGYFYALEQGSHGDDGRILDAVHIYNVESVVDKDRPSTADILWSADGMKVALSINGYPHAAFDFEARRGYCRMNFPNFAQEIAEGWSRASHQWDDGVMNFFRR
jgi:hypothetical protein